MILIPRQGPPPAKFRVRNGADKDKQTIKPITNSRRFLRFNFKLGVSRKFLCYVSSEIYFLIAPLLQDITPEPVPPWMMTTWRAKRVEDGSSTAALRPHCLPSYAEKARHKWRTATAQFYWLTLGWKLAMVQLPGIGAMLPLRNFPRQLNSLNLPVMIPPNLPVPEKCINSGR